MEITNDILYVGVNDHLVDLFEGQYDVPNGMAYNSYLIMDEKITLVDGVKSCMSQEMTERVKSVVDFSQISYVVVNHVEMDHSGNIPEIMKLAPQAVIITDNAGKMALEAHFDTAGWNYKLVTTGESVSIGKRSLTFMTTPMLHWPDSMMTYVKEEKLLLSNDGFGQHLASDGLFVNEQPLDLVVNEAKSYYANILFPYGAQAEKALNTAGTLGLDIEMIAPSHGCIWSGKDEVNTILGLYAKWASGKNEGKAVVVYDSMWGATAKMAEALTTVTRALSSRTTNPILDGIPVTKHCLAVENVSEVMVDFLDAAYVCIGNPTLNNQLFPRVAGFVTYMKGLAPRGKKALAFGSYGWKPGVVKQIQQVYEELGWQTVAPFEEKYTPKAEVLEQLKERVRELIKL